MPLSSQKDQSPIGYYVHHQGRGHAMRAQVLIQQLRRPVSVFTSRPDYFAKSCGAEVIALPLDYPAVTEFDQAETSRSTALHYAPLHVPGLRARMHTITEWIAAHHPAAFIVDVSVEVAMLARLLGVPTVVTKLQGDRSDSAHQIAFEQASAVLCPYPQAMEQFPLPFELRNNCIYTGAYSRFVGRSPFGKTIPGRILVFLGSGGTHITLPRIEAMANALPNMSIHLLGKASIAPSVLLPQNLTLLGQLADPWPQLCAAEVVLAGAGTNAVMEVGSAAKPLICFPEVRAFDEQLTKARALADAALAVCCEHWPSESEWPVVLAKARQLSPSHWQKYFTDPQLSVVAERIEAVCTRGISSPSRPPQKPARLLPV